MNPSVDIGRKVLMAESLPWNALYKVGSHHYATQFLKAGFDVCWMANPVSPFHRLSGSYDKYAVELKEKFRVWRRDGVREGGLLSYAPLTLLPYANISPLNSRFVLNNTLRFTLPPVKSFLRRKNFSRVDIAWFTNPVMAGLLDAVTCKHAVFRIADDIAAFDDIPETIRRQEQRLVERADAVFVTAKTILDRYAPLAGDKIHYLPNGVDFDFFQNAGAALPEEYARIPSPRIVYVGAIADWFDLKLMEIAARLCNTCSFVLIGEPRIDLSSLQALKNVFILGGKQYEAIPSYLKNADVGIIPFKKTRLVQSVNPIKLYEYMSCGLPVVAARWKTLEDINSPALLADTPEEFAGFILQAVNGTVNRQLSIDFARVNSWANRFQYVQSVLGGLS